MSRARRRFNPHGQWSLFDATGSSPLTSHEKTDPTEMDLMSIVVLHDVVSEAIRRVKANKGAPGVDGMTVDELDAHWQAHGARICQVLLAGEYIPRPVRRVTIPKPGGGERLLGIPTVQDRLVQQMLPTVLEPMFDPTFSDSSFGFRPNRSAHEAVERAKEHVVSGLPWVVDDRVNHDVLMGRPAKRITDRRMLKLLRRYLNAGVMLNGVVMETEEGTPQGVPLSPLLANLLLDDLDKELERRGLHFVRYADDCNIYVGSQAAAERVLESVTRFPEVKLRLKVNRAKSAAAPTPERKFLGFTIYRWKREWAIRISDKALERFRDKVRLITSRRRRILGTTLFEELGRYTDGWAAYFARFAGCESQLNELDAWIRKRLRQWLWVKWKTWPNRRRHLIQGGVWPQKAKAAIWTRSAWKAAGGQAMAYCVNNSRIRRHLIPLTEHWQRFASL
jgi:RNA-directed DNA polymerase